MMQFAFDILRATEAAAVASSEFIGDGDKTAADHAATEAMRDVLNEVGDFGGQIVIGEGKKDDAPGLFEGEKVGKGELAWDIAVDPLDGTTQTAKGGPGAMSVIAVGGLNKLFGTGDFYMLKMAYGPKLVHELECIANHFGEPLKEGFMDLTSNLNQFLDLAQHMMRRGGDDRPLTVCMLDRPRHADFIKTFRKYGWRVRLIQDCDVSAAIATALPDSGVDLYYGIGGAPEGVIAAAAMKCLGGHFEGIVVDKDLKPVNGKLLKTEDLAAGDVIFCATGVTSGDFLRGIHRNKDTGTMISHSVLLESKNGKIYRIECDHTNRGG